MTDRTYGDIAYRSEAARLARGVAKRARARNDWNHDTIECVANAAVAQAFDDYAAELENAPDG